ncbi:MAG: hypothetical protein RL749_1163, partial [Verrucomicrobiota bacterium]
MNYPTLLLALVISTIPTFAAETFLVEGHKAVIHPATKPAEGKPWL